MKKIPVEVVMPDGSISNNPTYVLEKWAGDFLGHLNTTNGHFSRSAPYIDTMYGLDDDFTNTDAIISVDDTLRAILRAKSGQSPDYDNIHAELIK